MNWTLLLFSLFFSACQPAPPSNRDVSGASEGDDPSGTTVATRFVPPAGATRISAPAASFGSFLRDFPLKPAGTPVYLYNGSLKFRQEVHAAVLDIDVGNRDLQQCADAVMRLRAEYLYAQKRYSDIHFNFTNGFRADYSRWRQGERIRVQGNTCSWVAGNENSTDYASFRRYLDVVFSYAGTASLAKELQPAAADRVMPGDVFIQGGHPGHAVIVLDVAADSLSGRRFFLLAQSYMPAQDIHVLKNFNNPGISPWYAVDPASGQLDTPEWRFGWEEMRRWQ